MTAKITFQRIRAQSPHSSLSYPDQILIGDRVVGQITTTVAWNDNPGSAIIGASRSVRARVTGEFGCFEASSRKRAQELVMARAAVRAAGRLRCPAVAGQSLAKRLNSWRDTVTAGTRGLRVLASSDVGQNSTQPIFYGGDDTWLAWARAVSRMLPGSRWHLLTLRSLGVGTGAWEPADHIEFEIEEDGSVQGRGWAPGVRDVRPGPALR